MPEGCFIFHFACLYWEVTLGYQVPKGDRETATFHSRHLYNDLAYIYFLKNSLDDSGNYSVRTQDPLMLLSTLLTE